MRKSTLVFFALAGCDMLGPRIDDVMIDAAPRPIDAAQPDASAFTKVLPAGSVVPSIEDNAELLAQLQVYDGLSDNALAQNNGVVTRSTGKAGGATVMFWSFGSVTMAGNFIVSAPVYILADDDGKGTLTPRTDHPWILDSIPGDGRYSALRRIIHVPVTPQYAGHVIASVEALAEAIELGLVDEPQPAGTWQNMPMVPPGTKLELGGTAEPMPATQVYAQGYRVDVLPLGGAFGVQPLRNGSIPMGQEARLLSGVASGTPPALPTSPDAQPVFQYGIPAAPPTTAFNYTPVVTQLDVRLANGVEPTAISNDSQLFRRTGTGALNGYFASTVSNYVVTTTVTNKQIQFAEGSP